MLLMLPLDIDGFCFPVWAGWLAGWFQLAKALDEWKQLLTDGKVLRYGLENTSWKKRVLPLLGNEGRFGSSIMNEFWERVVTVMFRNDSLCPLVWICAIGHV
jgi:hypothetical protein